MSLLKLNRINKGGEIFVNSDQIRFVEIEGRSSTVNMGAKNVYPVEEKPETIAAMIEEMETARVRNAIQTSGLVSNNPERS